ncbi:hypothetical protein OROGR_019579 [Orobanche gracilis]
MAGGGPSICREGDPFPPLVIDDGSEQLPSAVRKASNKPAHKVPKRSFYDDGELHGFGQIIKIDGQKVVSFSAA